MHQYQPQPSIDPEVCEYFRKIYGKENLQRIIKRLCFPSLKTFLRVNTTVATPQEVLRELKDFEEFTPQVSSSLPNLITLQGRTAEETFPWGDFSAKEILISRKTGESVLRGASVFAPGVLAASSGLSSGDSVAVFAANCEEKFTRGTVLTPGPCQEDGCLFLGLGTLHMSRSELFRSSAGLAVTLSTPVFHSPCLNGVLTGKIVLQNLPSIVTVHVLDPRPGWRVLDMCASPGVKTTGMAEIMKDQGCIIALDRTHKKVKRISDLASELGLSSISAFKMDATKVLLNDNSRKTKQSKELNPKELARKLRKEAFRIQCRQDPLPQPVLMSEGEGFAENSFDAVLLDAPCSALGLRPRLSFPQTISELKETAQYQRKLLDAALSVLKEDGVLVYSTCTINPAENEANVRYALDQYPALCLEKQSAYLGKHGLTGSADGDEQWLLPEEAELVQRFDPCDEELDTIGFFIAKFRKRGSIKQ